MFITALGRQSGNIYLLHSMQMSNEGIIKHWNWSLKPNQCMGTWNEDDFRSIKLERDTHVSVETSEALELEQFTAHSCWDSLMVWKGDELVAQEQQLQEAAEAETEMVSCALYLCDQAFGGPEEGGWWYDTYQLVDFKEARDMLPAHWQPQFAETIYDPELKVGVLPKAMKEHVNEANLILDHTVNLDRRDIHSVLSTGQYRVCWFEGVPASRPTVRPHYE